MRRNKTQPRRTPPHDVEGLTVAEIGDVQGVGLWRPGAPVPASVMLVDALAKGR
jgi:hypothetical protein